MREWTIDDLFKDMDFEHGYDYILLGRQDKVITDISSLGSSTTNDLAFCSSDDYEGIVSILRSNAGIILCKKKLNGLLIPSSYRRNNNSSSNKNEQQLLVFVENPRLVFMKMARKIRCKESDKPVHGISKKATVSETAHVGKNCHIGDFTTVGEECNIGDNTIINSRVTLKNCKIGSNCVIQSGCVIGEEGFAFERDPRYRWTRKISSLWKSHYQG